MIKSITIKNFKSISSEVTIRFSDITLLYGPNSIGKSSVIHALHLLREIFLNREIDPKQTQLGDESLYLGGIRNLVNGRDRSLKIHLKVELSVDGPWNRTDLHELDLQEEYGEGHAYLPFLRRMIREQMWPGQSSNSHFSQFPTHGYRQIGFLPVDGGVRSCAISVEIEFTEMDTVQLSTSTFLDDQLLMTRTLHGATTSGFTEGSVLCGLGADQLFPEMDYDFWDFKKIMDDGPLPPFELDGEDEPPEDPAVAEFRQRYPDGRVDEAATELAWKAICRKTEEFAKERSPHLRSWRQVAADWYRRRSHKLEMGSPRGYGFSTDLSGDFTPLSGEDVLGASADGQSADVETNFIIEAYNSYILYHAALSAAIQKRLEVVLENVLHVGPLRKHYLPPSPGEVAVRSWYSGLAAWDHVRERDVDVDDVNSWMEAPDRFNSGCRLELVTRCLIRDRDRFLRRVDGLSDLQQVLELLDQEENESAITIVNKKSLPLMTREVGTGVSQILPVIVAALWAKKGIRLFEQPELHLHPKMQMSVADVMLDAVVENSGKTFIVESHSEHVLLRLMRRIRQSNDQAAEYRVLPECVSVAFFENEDGVLRVRNIKIDANGEFIGPWPDDFFDLEFNERFA